MKSPNPLRNILLGSILLAVPAAHAGNTWTGGGASTNWSDINNWGGAAPLYGTLTFNAGGTQGTTSINNSISSMNQLFWTGTSAWTLNSSGGTVLSLFDNGGTQAKIENQSTGLVTINAPITFAATTGNNWGEINAVNGGITFGATGNLTVNGTGVNGIRLFGSGQTTTFNNTVSASGKYFATTGSNTTVAIGGAFTSGDFYLMNGSTLKINTGGTLTTSGGGALRLGGDFGTTGFQNLTSGATFQLVPLTGGLTVNALINTVASNTSGALLIDSLNTSGTNTLAGDFYLDSNLRVNQASGGTITISDATTDIKAQTLTLTGAGNVNLTGVVGNSIGSGQVVVGVDGTAGGPLVTMSLANTYSGQTFVRAGTLAFTSTGSAANSVIRLGSTSGTGVDAAVRLSTLTGATTISSTINAVTTSGTGALSINSLNTSGTNTLSGQIALDRNLTITQAAGGNLNISQVKGVDNTTGNDIKGFTETFNVSGTATGINVSGTIYNSTGSGSIVKDGTGTLTLGGTNTYTGGTTLNAGTLVTTADANLGTGGTLTVGGTSTWNAGGTSSVTYNRALTINAGTLSVTSGNAVKIITGILSGSGAINNTSTTGFNFSNTGNTFTGTVNNGYQMIFASLGDSSNAINLVGSNSEFQWSGGAKAFALRPLTLNATGTGNVNNNGTGAITFAADLAVTGTAGARTLALGGSYVGSNNVFSGNIANNGSVVAVTKNGAGTWNISGNMTNTGVVTINAGGPLILSGTNTYSGNTNFSGIGAQLTFAGSQAASPNTTLFMNTNASSMSSTVRFLDDTGNVNGGTATFGGTYSIQSNNTAANANTFIVGNNNTANGGTSSGTTTGSTLTIGTMNWSSVANNTPQVGNIFIQGSNGYRLQINNLVMFNGSGHTAGNTNNTNLYPTTANVTLGAVTMATGNAVNGVIPTLVLDGTSSDNRITGIISNASDVGTSLLPVNVTKSSTSTWTFTGSAANTYSGATLVTGGTLALDKSAGNAIAGGTVTIGAANNTAATVQYTGASNDMIGAGTMTINGRGILDFNGKTDTIGNVLIVSTGATTTNPTPIINTAGGGNLTIGSLGITPVAAFTSVVNPGTLGTITLGGDVTFTAATTGLAQITGGTLALGAATRNFNIGLGTTAGNANPDLQINSIISGSSVGLSKNGSGRLWLSGANTFNGTTTVNGGVIALNNVNAIQNSSAVSVTAGTLQFVIGGTYATAGTISIAGTGSAAITANTGALWFGQGGSNNTTLNAPINLTAAAKIASYGNNMNQTLGGQIGGGVTAGSTALTIQSQGGNSAADVHTWTLNAASNYTGDTIFTESGGVLSNTLKLGVTDALPTTTILTLSPVTASKNTRLDLNDQSQQLAGLLNTGTAANAIVLNSGAGTPVLTINNSGANTFSGLLGTGGTNFALTKTGAGALTLSGTNTYTGATNISAGALKLGAAGSGANTPLGTIAAGTLVTGTGTLDLNGFTLATSEALSLIGTGTSNSGALANTGAAATYSGLITLTGAASINSTGNILLSNASAITGSGFGLTLDGSATGSTLNIIGTGGGTLTKSGAGTWTLNGASTYSGATTIKAGTLVLGASGSFANSPSIVVGDAGSGGAVLDLTAKASFSFSNTQTVNGIGTINIGATKSVTIAGILAPGNSIGTINETGNLILTGTLQTELGTPGATPAAGLSDRTAVSGNLTLTSGTLQLINNAGANAQGSIGAGAYRIATYGGTLTGTFGTITNPFSATLHEKVVYGGGNVDLNLYRLATANTIGTPVALTNVRVGGTFGTSALSIQNTAANDGFSEGLNATQGATTGSASVGGTNITNLTAGSSSSTILVGLGGNLNTGTAGALSGTVAIGLASNGTGTSGYGTTAISGQTISVTGSAFNAAVANTVATPVTLTNVRVGETFGTSALSISNTAPVSAFTEGLNATQGATTGQASVGGTDITNLAGGSSSSTISVGLGGNANTGTAGAITGTVAIGFASNGTNSGLADLALADQTVTVNGSVFNAAVANILATPVTLTNVHVGETFGTSALSISNTAPSGAFTEGLNATQGATTGSASVGGTNITNLAAGSSSSSISVGLGGNANTGTAGAKTGTVAIGFASNGTNSGLADLALAGQSVTVTGGVYNLAASNLLSSLNLGTIHKGESFTSAAVPVTNTSASGAYTEGLNASFGSTTGSATHNGGTVINLAGAASDSTSLTAGLSGNPSVAGTFTGTVGINFASNGSNSGLANTTLSPQTVALTGQVNEYAQPLFTGGAGLSGSGTSYTLNLGSFNTNTGVHNAGITLENFALDATYQDVLGGSFSLAGGTFSLTGFGSPVSLSSGNTLGGLLASFDTTGKAYGTYNGSFTFFPTSVNGSSTTSLASITMGVELTVIPEPGSLASLLGGLGVLVTLQRRRRKL